MSSLRSALDEFRAEDLGSLSDAALAGHLDEIEAPVGSSRPNAGGR